MLLELYEGNRLKREKVSLIYENGRIRRENEGLALQITSSSQMTKQVIEREFALKEKIITIKNELVKLKVANDMG